MVTEREFIETQVEISRNRTRDFVSNERRAPRSTCQTYAKRIWSQPRTPPNYREDVEKNPKVDGLKSENQTEPIMRMCYCVRARPVKGLTGRLPAIP